MSDNYKISKGDKFGRLTVLFSLGGKLSREYFICKCSCYNFHKVRTDHLINGKIVSCGCKIRELRTTHGLSKSKEYRGWKSMIQRCHNSNGPRFYDYGGRGIFVCRRWRKSFENFYKDMGERPKGKTIDRIDNNGPYAPWNCRWSTLKEQSRNTRRNKVLNYKGERKSLSEWAEIFNINYDTIIRRLGLGWSVEKSLEEPPQKQYKRKILYNNKSYTLPELSRKLNTPYSILYKYLIVKKNSIESFINNHCV